MSFLAPVRLNIQPAELETSDLGFALASGRLVAGVVSDRTGEQITVRAVCKAPSGDYNKPMQRCAFAEATVVYLDVPHPDHGRGDVIGVYRPQQGRFEPDRVADPARVWACLYVLLRAAGRDPEQLLGVRACSQARLHISDHCLRCGKEIWLESSVQGGMGNTCRKSAERTVSQQKAKRGEPVAVPHEGRRRALARADVLPLAFDRPNLKEF